MPNDRPDSGSERPRISVVVINWNTNALLDACLASLHADPACARRQIIVIDNASDDDPTPMVGERYPAVEMLRSDANLGFSRGNNLAARRAEGEYILFFNADTEAPRGAVEALADFLDAHADAGIVGPRMKGADGRPQVSAGRFPGALVYLRSAFFIDSLLKLIPGLARRLEPWGEAGGPVPVDYIPGAALMIRRAAFEEIGGWPEAYFFYGEDAELALRLRDTSTPISYLARDVRIVHLGGGSVEAISNWKSVAATRAVLLFVQRNRSSGALLATRSAVLAGNLPRLLALLIALPAAALLGRGRAWLERIGAYAAVIKLALSPAATFERADEPGVDGR